MKCFFPVTRTLFAISLEILAAGPASAQDLLTGERRLACEAVLCLASGRPPQDCQPALRRYFGIQGRKPGDTVRERANFLRLCPASNQSPPMTALVDAMAAGAGACDPATLNSRLQQGGTGGVEGSPTRSVIGSDLPAPCAAYTGSAYVDAASLAVRHVGTPERGGHWIDAAYWNAAQPPPRPRTRRQLFTRRVRPAAHASRAVEIRWPASIAARAWSRVTSQPACRR